MKRSQVLKVFRKEKENHSSMLRSIRFPPKDTSSSSDLKIKEEDLSPIDGAPLTSNEVENTLIVPNASKLFYVNPLTKEEVAQKQQILDSLDNANEESISENRSTHENSNVNENFDGMARLCSEKRTRIGSDDEDNAIVREGAKKRRLCISDDDDDDDEENESHSKPHTSSSPQKFTPEMIEKLLDTYCDIYPLIERMEVYDTMKLFNFNFSEMTKSLDIKNRELNHEIKIKKTNHEREERKMKKKAEQLRKKAVWKSKALLYKDEEAEDDEEDYIGKSKIYDSDSSEDETSFDAESVVPARNMVLNFFNECSVTELGCVPGCSKKKAEILINARPFDNFQDLVYKIKRERNISTDLLNSAKDMLQMRNGIKKLMNRCERISLRMKNFVKDVVSEEDISLMRKQPQLMNEKMRLKNYQLVGMNWLLLMHDQGLNAILADEMGLGKTVQSIAFLAHLKEAGDLNELCLIVVPSSTLDNWSRELETWVPSMKFLTYHGSQEDRRGMRNSLLFQELEEEICIILTTYSMVTSNSEDRALFKKLKLHTIIYDEAHMLKNMTSLRYENLMKIKCGRRILLTGTPLQNNLVELMSILVFVMPKLFEGKKEDLKKVFSMFTKNDDCNGNVYEEERINQAKQIMAPFFLRRLKNTVLKELPQKTEEIVKVLMSDHQRCIYKETIKLLSSRTKELKEELQKTKMKNLEDIEDLNSSTVDKRNKFQIKEDSCSNMLMKLRKIANHPLLVRNHYTIRKIEEMAKILKKTTHQDSLLDYIVEDFSVMSDFEIHQTCKNLKPIEHMKLTDEVIVNSGKMKILDEFLPDMKKKGDRVLLFSQFVIVLDIIEEYVKIHGYKYCRLDGQTQVMERQEMIDEYNEDDNIFLFLLSTRAGGLGINLTSANTVILHDIDFNPYNDKQAEDRCHRVGQTRDVRIIRFLSTQTIEEGIYQIAQSKLQLEKDVTGKNDENHCKSDVVTLLKTALQTDIE